MLLKIFFFVIRYLVIGTLVTVCVSWYTGTDFDVDDEDDVIDVIILIAIWPITVISAVFAGFALLIADKLKNKKS